MSEYQATLERGYADIRRRLFPAPPPQPFVPMPAPRKPARDTSVVERIGTAPVTLIPGVGCNRIIAVVAAAFELRSADLRSKARDRFLVIPRHAAMYMIRVILPAKSLPEIARRLNRHDHTTALWGVRKTMQRMRADAAFAHTIAEIEQYLLAEVQRLSP